MINKKLSKSLIKLIKSKGMLKLRLNKLKAIKLKFQNKSMICTLIL